MLEHRSAGRGERRKRKTGKGKIEMCQVPDHTRESFPRESTGIAEVKIDVKETALIPGLPETERQGAQKGVYRRRRFSGHLK